MPKARDKSIRRRHQRGVACPTVLLLQSVLCWSARLPSACAGFRPSFSGATRQEKDLGTTSCIRSGLVENDSRKEPTAMGREFDCSQLHTAPQVGARSCPTPTGHLRPATGCSPPG